MKNIKLFAVVGFLVLAVFVFGSSVVYGMPPHPDLEQKIKDGKVAKPYPIEFRSELEKKGVDQPGLFNLGNYLKVQKPLLQKGASTVTFRMLLVLVDFSDKVAQTPATYFDTLAFSDSVSSIKKFYLENSYGVLDIVTVNLPSSLGWQRAPQTHAYYVNGNYGFGAYPNNSQKLTEDLVDLIDPLVDFRNYDNDGDGYVDGILIGHAGRGAELTYSTNDFWSHKWGINPRLKDSVLIMDYSIQPEYWYSSGDMTIGVYAHESGHLFGLPDLYDVDGSSRGVGRWSLMAGGSWNGGLGSSPAHFDAWSKKFLNFVSPSLIQSAPMTLQLPAVENSPTVFRVNTASLPATEYFLLENRQKLKYDSGLPGAGLLIWHVDENKPGNNQEWYPGLDPARHYKVALEQADGLWEMEKNIDTGDIGDPYPGIIVNRRFDSASVPNTDSYGGMKTTLGVGNISDSGAVMTADISGLLCGDLNFDGQIDVIDVSVIVDYVIRGVLIPPNVNVDLNADGRSDIIDVVILVDYIFRGGPAPTCISQPTGAFSLPGKNSTVLTSQNLKVGGQIKTADNLKVRVKPGGLVVAGVGLGSRGKIIGGPFVFGGYRWWNIEYLSGVKGWSAENWLEKVTPSR